MKKWILGGLLILTPTTLWAADVKFSSLATITSAGLAGTDIFVLVDDDANVGKSITTTELDSRWQDIVSDTSPQLGGNLDLNSNSLVSTSNADVDIAPNGTGKVTITGASLEVAERIKGNNVATIGASAIDWATGNFFTKTLSANTTFTFSNVPTSGGQSISIRLIQDATTRTVTWPAAVEWEGGTAPVMSTGSGDVDVCTFIAWSSSVISGSCVQDLQ